MKKICVGLVIALGVCMNAWAGVAESKLTSDIVDRQPQDDLNAHYTAPADGIGKIYFYTRLTDLAGKQVTHRWLHDGKVMAEVTLNIGSNNWRTYSSKRIVPSWSGQWQIDVLVDGEVIHSFPFEVER